jgi:hypothetical protein
MSQIIIFFNYLLFQSSLLKFQNHFNIVYCGNGRIHIFYVSTAATYFQRDTLLLLWLGRQKGHTNYLRENFVNCSVCWHELPQYLGVWPMHPK